MKKYSEAFIIIGIVSLAIGIASRLSVIPIFGMESRAFAGFSALCLLLSIAISVLKEDKQAAVRKGKK